MDPYCPIKVPILNNYAATLNQVEIAQNNNKYYILQVLDDGNQYHLYTRYGRVGDKGRTGIKTYKDKNVAISEFCKTFKTKTGNTWDTPFVKKPGKYMLLELEAPTLKVVNSSSAAAAANSDTSKEEMVEGGKLDPRVSRIIQMIGNKKMMNQTLIHLDIDTARLPLGKISKNQIKQANEILKYISDNIDTLSPSEFIAKSSEFWTIVPFGSGRRPPPVLNELIQITQCSRLLETLENIEIAGTILQQNNTDLDVYNSLGLTLTPMESDDEFELIKRYISITHGKTHKYSLEIVSAFKVNKDADNTVFNSIPNHCLLFHGSRMANFIGILSEGLRIPRNDQVLNGSTLGNGIYFADSVTKSYNYTYSSETDNLGFILICEVALGNPEFVTGCNPYPLDSNYHSRIAQGNNTPDPSGFYSIDEVVVPCGSLVPNPNASHSTFLYNEYVVYNKNQYRFKYLVLCGMNSFPYHS